MRLAINIGYWGGDAGLDLDLVLAAEKLGYDSVWAAEAWGSDAVTVLAYVAARTNTIKVGSGILQMPARTPAMTAMTAATLSDLSSGRFLLGLGLSGPQVVEGWHGQPYGKPLGKTREYVAIVRRALARTAPLVHAGEHYQIPYTGPGSTGLGKPLKLMTRPAHPIPIYIAALGPKNVALTAEIADGWLPVLYSPYKAAEVFGPALAEGFGRSAEDGKADRFDTVPAVSAVVTDEPQRARDRLKPGIAMYIGGMGAKGRNFYNDLVSRYGYAEAAAQVQDLYLAGERRAATAAVPDALVDELNLIGTKAELRDRLDVWREAGVTTLNVSAPDRHTLETLAEVA